MNEKLKISVVTVVRNDRAHIEETLKSVLEQSGGFELEYVVIDGASDDGTVEVYGSPWSGKTPCYRNEHYPAGAFVQIRRSPDNVITRLSVLESYALLYSSSSGFKSDAAMADGLHATFEKIISRIPCYALDCRPDADAARVCSAELMK